MMWRVEFDIAVHPQPERQSALAEFTAGRISVLVATDVASRGLDIKGIGHVVNADLPKTFEDYVHRIGTQFLSRQMPTHHFLAASCHPRATRIM